MLPVTCATSSEKFSHATNVRYEVMTDAQQRPTMDPAGGGITATQVLLAPSAQDMERVSMTGAAPRALAAGTEGLSRAQPVTCDKVGSSEQWLPSAQRDTVSTSAWPSRLRTLHHATSRTRWLPGSFMACCSAAAASSPHLSEGRLANVAREADQLHPDVVCHH